MRREGSAVSGLGVVFAKEFGDNLISARMRLLLVLVVLILIAAVYTAMGFANQAGQIGPFPFLAMFTEARNPVPSVLSLLGFLIPIGAITLGFDSVNSERNRRTLSRILAQPIYRDALLIGKFLAGLMTIALALIVLWLLIAGFSILVLGIPPSGNEAIRATAFLIVSIVYGGVWLALAMLFSTFIPQTATSALAALALWLVMAVFWSMAAQFIALAMHTPTGIPEIDKLQVLFMQQDISRFSPNTLYSEAAVALLHPSVHTLNMKQMLFAQVPGAVLGEPLPLIGSLVIIWPQITGLVAATIVLFTMSYTIFQRQEVRA